MTTSDGDTGTELLRARGVSAEGSVAPHGLALLPPTSLAVRSGEVVVVAGDPGPAHVLLALALAGRLEGAGGTVDLDGSDDRRTLQRAVALLDVPGVTEPEPGLPLRTVVGEGLAVAGRPAGRGAVRRWLEEARVDGATPYDGLAAEQRLGLVLGLAALRSPRFAVLTLPERYGGHPSAWVGRIAAFAATGVGVVVTASHGQADHFGARVVTMGGAAVAAEQEEDA